MSRHEQVYDILDIIRVIKSVALPVLLVPIVAAVLVGYWAFTSARDGGFTSRVYAVIRMPERSVEADEIEKSVLSAATALGEDNTAFDTSVEEVPAVVRTPYRTVRVTIDTGPDIDGRALLESAIQMVAASVDAFDADLQRQLSDIEKRRAVISGYLSTLVEQTPASPGVPIVAEANAVSSLVSAASVLEQDARQLAELGRGPLQFVTPVEGPTTPSSLRWLRYPIVAWFAGLLAVLFVAFTLDGVRLARAKEVRKA